MKEDPIIEEVRRAREKLAAESGYDTREFVERLRQNQRASKRRIVSFAHRNREKSGSES